LLANFRLLLNTGLANYHATVYQIAIDFKAHGFWRLFRGGDDDAAVADPRSDDIAFDAGKFDHFIDDSAASARTARFLFSKMLSWADARRRAG
jgi:hypothetical protein